MGNAIRTEPNENQKKKIKPKKENKKHFIFNNPKRSKNETNYSNIDKYSKCAITDVNISQGMKKKKSNNTNLNVTSHMNNSLYSEYNTTKGIINTNPNNVSAGNSICGNNTTVKRPLKVIQNFSNYKRKSELMNSSKRSIKEKN